MAKKKAAPRPRVVKGARVKKQKQQAAKAKAAVRRAVRKPLEQPTLPTMRVRDARMDKLAEAIGHSRDQQNVAAADEKAYKAAALKVMQDKGYQFWSHAGVDLIRTPGEDKLKVKTHKDGGSAETGADEETGSEQPEFEHDGDEGGADEGGDAGGDDAQG